MYNLRFFWLRRRFGQSNHNFGDVMRLAILAALAALTVTAAATTQLSPLHLSDPSHVYDVIVVGAGMAGARAAAALLEGNVNNFLVVDQQPRLGGRMWNVAFGAWTIEKVPNICFCLLR